MGQKDTRYLKEFGKKDLIVLKSEDFEDTKVGEEIYYYAVENEKYVIKTGTISDKSGEASDAIYTIAEAETKEINSDKVLGKLDKVYHNVGQVLFFLSSRIGFLILVLFIYEIYDFVMNIKYEKVEPEKTTKKDKKTEKKDNKENKNEEIETL